MNAGGSCLLAASPGWTLIAAPLAWLLLALAEKAMPSGFLAAHMREQPPGTRPVRQLGGLVLIPLHLAGLAVIARYHPDDRPFLTVFGAATALLWLVGIADDHRHRSTMLRLTAHCIAAFAVAASLPPSLTVLDGMLPIWIERALIVAALVYAINVTNFMDGMDLMSVAGLAIPLCASALLMANGAGYPPIALASLVLAAGLLGFAPFNRPPARLYLGDNGALPLGLAAGVAGVTLAADTQIVAAILPFGYYLADSASTLVLRALRGENLLNSHSGHAYQVARRAGRPVGWVIARVVAANLALALTAWFATRTQGIGTLFAAAIVGLVISAAIVVHFRRQAGADRA